MDPRVQRGLTVGRAIVHEIRTERVTFMAGSIAYHAFVSILPLLLLLLAAVSAIGQSEAEQGIIALAGAALTPGAADALVTELRTASTSVSVLGVTILVWGTLRIFRGLDTAFSDIYESAAENTLLDQFADGIVVFVCVAVAIVVAALLHRTVQFGGPVGWVLGRVALMIGLALVFLPMYYVFPDEADMQLREVFPGVAFTAIGLTAFETVFRFYLQFRGDAASGDVLAGLLVFMTWLYFTGLVMLVGVAINAVLSNRSSDVNIRPVVGGQPKETDSGTGAGRTEHVDSDTLRDTVGRLESDLSVGRSVSITVDDDEVSVPPPDAVEVEVDESRLPFVSDAVSLELRWTPDESE